MNKAALVKHSVRIAGHATSVSLEPAFWTALREIAACRGLSLNSLLAEIDARRSGNLSSAARLFVLENLRRGGIGNAGAEAAGGGVALPARAHHFAARRAGLDENEGG